MNQSSKAGLHPGTFHEWHFSFLGICLALKELKSTVCKRYHPACVSVTPVSTYHTKKQAKFLSTID